MTSRVSGGSSAMRRLVGAACAALGLAVLAGCASTPEPMTGVNERGPINTGTYPNLNIPPQSAAEPITPVDKQQMYTKVGSARQKQTANAVATSPQGNLAVLKKLAANHGKDTLAAIEKQ